ncbi:hypothetical protein [Halohasta litorea]|uniref:Gingipain domain-containing protein n=1 Tax=Halohasta litorea TaxID=869891 RepID=A0ABD6D9V0_9EURY|nr:hypothetical protein [Halohasta litorea]
MPDDPWLGPQHLPAEGDEVYVGWVDLMGVGDAMSRSYQSAAVNVGKLFAAVANHRFVGNVEVYPMVDGMYILSDDDPNDDEPMYIPTILSNIFRQFGNLTYMRDNDASDNYGPWLGFLLRGGIAQGVVYHGSDFDSNGDSDISNVDWLDSIPFGEPIANAHNIERGLAPYGIGIHESASDNPRNWKWWESYDDDTRQNIISYLENHFSWCMSNIDQLSYEESRLYVHINRAEAYFDLPDGYFDI